jgi:two-component system sensor histidine kinase MtrB
MNIRRRRLFLRPPTIRTLVVLWAGSVLFVWVILVGGWFVAKNQLTRIEGQVATDIAAMDATHKLEAALLAYRHDDLLWHENGQGNYEQEQEKSLASAERIVDDFHRYIDTPKEEKLLAAIREKLGILRSQLSLRASTPAEIEQGSTFDLLGVVRALQMEEQNQMEASIRAANRLQNDVSGWAIGLSAGTAVLLFAGALDLIRRIIRPTLAITTAAQSFGQGDFSANATVLHEDELGGLARTFNNMARDIADREKDRLQFVAMVVHDLKNPVLAIDMATRQLDRARITAEQRDSYVAGVREEVVRLQGIIRDLTDDIQVVNGRFSVRKTEVDVGTLVRRFVTTQSKAFATHRIVVQADEGCTILGDADRIARVLTNLVSNAVKYSPAGTRISLRVEKRQTQAVLTVSDEGPGIAPEDLAVLFQPFGRGRSAHTLAEGTGIGLYVVKQIVEAHDGRIEVQSKPGQGATFQIELPLIRTAETVR